MTREWRLRLKYLLSDFCLLNIGWLLFTVIRYSVLPVYFTDSYSFTQHVLSTPVLLGQIIFPFMLIGLYWISGYYSQMFFKSRVDEAVNTAYVSLIGTLLIFFAVIINDDIPDRWQNYEMVLYLWLLLFVPVLLGRVVLTNIAARKVRTGEISFNTVIIGSTEKAVKIIKKMSNYRRPHGFNIVGIVEQHPLQSLKSYHDIPVFAVTELEYVVRNYDVVRFVAAPQTNDLKKIGELINHLFRFDCSIYVTPDLYNLIVARPRIANVIDEPLVDITNAHIAPSTLNCKRLADIIISFSALILLIPVYIAIALAVKREKSGSVIYSQERIGYHKHPFKIYKFRTMKVDAEIDGPSLSSNSDERITRTGRFLRKYRLDELPQFYNVLRGDMSLVGPRPERDYYIHQIIVKAPYYNLVHQVRPGITSWGMVKYGYASNVDQMIERLQYDLLYLDNVSLQVDLKILFHTVNTVLTGKGL